MLWFSGAPLDRPIGIVLKAAVFTIPFRMAGAPAVLGLIPMLLISWDTKRCTQRQ